MDNKRSNMYRIIALLLDFLMLASLGCGGQTQWQTVSQTAAPAPTATPEPVFEPCDALFYGESVTKGNNFDEFFPNLSIVDMGINGGTLEDLIEMVPIVDTHHPARIFIMAGGNNLNSHNVEECVDLYRTLLDTLQKDCPYAEIYIESMLPINKMIAYSWDCPNRTIKEYNKRLSEIAEEYGLTYLEIYPAYLKEGGMNDEYSRDGIHLNDDAFGPWAEILRPYLEP